MAKKKTLSVSYQVWAIIGAAFILGFFYYQTQRLKQESIEAQQRLEIQAENDKLEKQKKEEKATETVKQIQIDACMREAYDEYIFNWNRGCKSKGLKDDCSLPSAMANGIEDGRKDDEGYCLTRYN